MSNRRVSQGEAGNGDIDTSISLCNLVSSFTTISSPTRSEIRIGD